MSAPKKRELTRTESVCLSDTISKKKEELPSPGNPELELLSQRLSVVESHLNILWDHLEQEDSGGSDLEDE